MGKWQKGSGLRFRANASPSKFRAGVSIEGDVEVEYRNYTWNDQDALSLDVLSGNTRVATTNHQQSQTTVPARTKKYTLTGGFGTETGSIGKWSPGTGAGKTDLIVEIRLTNATGYRGVHNCRHEVESQ